MASPADPPADLPPPSPGASLRADLREALRGSEQDYTRGPIGRAILLLAVPMVVEMLMESIFAVADVFFVGRLGAAAVATVGLTEALMSVLYTVAMGLGIGATAMVARRIGEQDADGAARAAVQVVLLGALLAAAIGVAGALFARDLLVLMGADAATLAVGVPYARVSLGLSVTVLLLFLVNAVFRGAGDPAVAMRVLIVGNSLNIVLDPLLIFGWGPFPGLGLVGAAWATVIGRGVGLAWALWQLLRGTGRLAVRRRHLTVDPGTMARVAELSGWGTVQTALATLSWMGLARLTAGFGATAMAGYTIAIRILLFVLMPAYGVGAAAATMVGQALGANDPRRAERSVWTAARITVTLLTLAGAGFWFLATPLVGAFTGDQAVVAVAERALRIMGLGFPAFALGMTLEQGFNGAGDTRTPTFMNAACFWLVQLPVAWALSRHTALGVQGIFWAVTVAYTALSLVSATLFRRGGWRGRRV
jgi:putative MATE family efflux protein